MEAYFGLDYEIKWKRSPLFYNYDILFYLMIDNYEMVKFMRYKIKKWLHKIS